MAVSQSYLNHLEEIGIRRGFEFEGKEDLLASLEYEWTCLQDYWTDKEDTWANDTKINSLIDLAEMGYELLAAITGEDWNQIISAAKELHEKKNSGYSPSEEDAWANFRECEKFGISAVDGVITRLCDKYTRFFNVYQDSSKDKVNESAVDTLRDFSAYCLIAVCLLEEVG